MATKKNKTSPDPVGFFGLGIPPEVRAAAITILRWLGAPPETGATAGSCCCGDVCSGVAAGKLMLVACDGAGMKALQGTADGQYPAWDATAQTWVLANV